MSLNLVPAGKDLPEDIYVVIEIPANADPIKYEIDKETGALFVDRFMSTAMFYPCNYGYINHTLSLDGDPVDVLVPTPYPLQPGSVIRCRPVGVLKMTDEAGEDAKLVAVPHSKLTKEYDRERRERPAGTAESPDRSLLRALQRSGKRQMGESGRLGRRCRG